MAVDREKVLLKVIQLTIETLKIEDKSKVVEDTKFVDDLGADSLEQIDFIMAAEDEYEIEVPDEAVEKIFTIGDAVDYIVKQLEKKEK